MIEIGCTSEVTLVVRPEDTAKDLSLGPEDEFPEVFATSRMIALMELAAARLMRPLLAEGQLSVGVGVDIRHIAPTPVGAAVRAVATYLGQEGRLFRFRVESFDHGGAIGDGEHTRAVVETQRLLAGAAKRRENPGHP